jgi:uncharacterized protein (DUF58 family)
MPEALLRQLDLSLRRRVNGLLAGERRSTALGLGTELAQVLPYQPGDDVRLIDWNVTARTGEPHVRVQVAERAMTTWLVLDVSPSMVFGTADRRKADVAEGVALAVGNAASRRGNRLGVITFGDGQSRTLPPKQGRPGLTGLLKTLGREPLEEGAGATSLRDTVERVARLAKRGSLVVLVSDFRTPLDWRRELVHLGARAHVVAVEVRDPREQELPDVGIIWLVDPETGRLVRADTKSAKLRQRFAERAAAERDGLAELLRSARADHVVLSTDGDWLRTLAGFLRRLEMRGRARHGGGGVVGARHGEAVPSMRGPARHGGGGVVRVS